MRPRTLNGRWHMAKRGVEQHQFNFRIGPEDRELLEALARELRNHFHVNVSYADILKAGLREMAKRYLSSPAAAGDETKCAS